MPFKQITCVLLILIAANQSHGQDPAFSQFFSSPLNVNPALTGIIHAPWRIISNLRDEWVSPASPYTTGTISYDAKIMKNKIPESSIFGFGTMLMYDQAMRGALKSNYASLNVSYNIKIAESEEGEHRLGAGFGLTYVDKRIDFGMLDFSAQFNGYGFDKNLPTGETALSNMKAYLSASNGILYTYKDKYMNLDIGVAGFHLNKPKQTAIKDDNQYLAPRYVVHGNFEDILNDYLVLNTNAIYQEQSGTHYFSVGGSLGYYLTQKGEDDIIVNAGLWYWSKNAVIPYIGLAYKNFQFGITYDVTVSKLAQASSKPKTFELSLIIRGIDKPTGVIYCPGPWK
ncbi:MAG: PorP/SprF family type IX secretion system membrane protein [Chitinophagaceae bacterium]|nr:PorP/SprF family type IX secretion system membrane protein [Chitinophagaceae bacterium]